MRCIACVFVLVWVAGGCADKVEDEAPFDSARASHTLRSGRAGPQPVQNNPVKPTLSIVKLDADRVAIDLHAESWPGRALDPVLTIGQLRLTEYEHPSKEVLRFVVPDASQLVAGAEVVLQYGDDDSSRVVVTQSLEVPR